jgi:hypothetical protein
MNAPASTPAHEHEFRETLSDDVYYPDHTRVATPTFAKTKRDGKKQGAVCAISGQAEGIEYHHLICEDAFTDGVDWMLVKRIATGEVTQLPVLDPASGLPCGASFPVSKSLLGLLLALTHARGFDWQAFDPAKPETFVDSAANMLVLHEQYHRSSARGIHRHSFPIWVFQAFPRAPGYVYSPSELAARHGVKT